ncbi:hypothetical protein E2C01_051440 [Portunus trituberculatus]|uniref:Uncharacterized protein n=1 Tax=Portunus trituberculatus TaxID=210409 RepID=A0A5B7GBM0_PORTR|nr:hypothetical protein [Portunus trituberculatus]
MVSACTCREQARYTRLLHAAPPLALRRRATTGIVITTAGSIAEARSGQVSGHGGAVSSPPPPSLHEGGRWQCCFKAPNLGGFSDGWRRRQRRVDYSRRHRNSQSATPGEPDMVTGGGGKILRRHQGWGPPPIKVTATC